MVSPEEEYKESLKNRGENWFGITSHPTDSYIHWSNNEPEEEAKRLRELWSKIVKTHEDEKVIEELLSEAYRQGSRDESDAHNEDL